MDALPIVSLPENSSKVVTEFELSEEDRRFADGLRSSEYGNLSVEELRHGFRISATSWVGVIRFNDFEVHVRPKLKHGFQSLIQLIDYVDDLGQRRDQQDVLKSQTGDNLLEIIATLFASASERLLRTGVISGYRTEQASLQLLRGRYLPLETALRQIRKPAEICCRFDERTTDITENQILALATAACVGWIRSMDLSRRVRILRSEFERLCPSQSKYRISTDQEFIYTRLNEHYRSVHHLAMLILRGLGIGDIYQRSSGRCFAFMIDLSRYFEKFVRKWLSQCTYCEPTLPVTSESISSVILDAKTNSKYAKINPDIVIRLHGNQAQAIPIDAKYKEYNSDTSKVQVGDIYQTFLYALALKSLGSSRPAAIIIHPRPAFAPVRTAELKISIQDRSEATIHVLGIDIDATIRNSDSSGLDMGGNEILEVINTQLRSLRE